MIVTNVFNVIGIALYLYLVWRNLGRDYNPEDLISYGWLSVLIWLAGGRIGYGLVNWGVWNENWWNWFEFWRYPGTNFLSAYFFWFLLTWWWGRRMKWKLWQFLEDVVGVIMTMAALGVLGEWLGGGGMDNLVYLVIIAIGGIFSVWLRSRYRSFFWYKSGKRGFVFLAINLLVFALLAIYWWLIGKWWRGNLALILGLLSGAGLVILGKED